jgi:hypothetical protein
MTYLSLRSVYPKHTFKEGHEQTNIELFVTTNALRQFFHCFLYYYDAPIRISAVILPSSRGILSEFLHRLILWLRHNSESVFTTSYKIFVKFVVLLSC